MSNYSSVEFETRNQRNSVIYSFFGKPTCLQRNVSGLVQTVFLVCHKITKLLITLSWSVRDYLDLSRVHGSHWLCSVCAHDLDKDSPIQTSRLMLIRAKYY